MVSSRAPSRASTGPPTSEFTDDSGEEEVGEDRGSISAPTRVRGEVEDEAAVSRRRSGAAKKV